MSLIRLIGNLFRYIASNKTQKLSDKTDHDLTVNNICNGLYEQTMFISHGLYDGIA
ncbi:MAG: hypothetical protein IJ583_04700 [Firmicutes bacterium]|nr:hypothetical protein [Bacillota bacterium]